MIIMDTVFDRQRTLLENNRFHFKRQYNAQAEVQMVEDLVRTRLKIAIVTETWPPELNGVALSLVQICKGLQRLGHKILLIRPYQKQKCMDFSPNKECLVYGQTIPKYSQMQFGWPQYRKVSDALDSFMPDIVHVVTEGPLGLAVLQSAKSRCIPVTSGFHSAFQDFSRFYDLAFLLKPIRHYLKWFHNNTQLTCVPSEDTAQAILDFGVTCPIEVVKTGVDVEKFSPKFRSDILRHSWRACEKTTVMLYVGRLSPEKEIQVLIQSYLSMGNQPNKKRKLVIVGDGPDRLRLEKLAQHSDVVFTGSLKGTQLAEVFASADVFVFASQVETFGNVILEAMASALPVVAYHYAAAKLHLDNETSWLCPLGQKHEFIQNMKQLPDNRTLHAMGRKAMKKVQSIGWNHSVQQLEQAFYRVVQETEITA